MPQNALAQDLAKAKLLQEAEEQMATLLEEAVTWQGEHPDATWDELELEVLKLRQRFGAQLAKVLIKQRAEKQTVPGPQCPECGKEMHYKGKKARKLVSMLGEIPLKRGYYYCSQCKRSVFPPGSSAGTEGAHVEPAPDADADIPGRTATLQTCA